MMGPVERRGGTDEVEHSSTGTRSPGPASPASSASPGPQLPGPLHLLGWVGAVLREVSYAPATIAGARRLLVGIGDLPGQLERVVAAVEQTTEPLSGSLEDVAEALAEIRDRLEHLDTVIWHLRDTLVSLISAVPGARRALDRLPPPPPPSTPARQAGGLGRAASAAPRSAEGGQGGQGYDASCPE